MYNIYIYVCVCVCVCVCVYVYIYNIHIYALVTGTDRTMKQFRNKRCTKQRKNEKSDL